MGCKICEVMAKLKKTYQSLTAEEKRYMCGMAARLLSEGITPDNATKKKALAATSRTVAPAAFRRLIDRVHTDLIKSEMRAVNAGKRSCKK